MMEGNCSRSEAAKDTESVCLSELDHGFLTDGSLSALPTEGALKKPRSIVIEYTEPTLTLSASCTCSMSMMPLLSPTISMHAIGMNSMLEAKSSTPYERMPIHKPVLATSLNHSCIDLSTSHPLWEVSLIRPNLESPKLYMDSSKIELTWSPSYQAASPVLAEISSLICSGTPVGGPRSCWEFTFQDSNMRHAVLELTDEQQKTLSRNMAM